MLNIIGIFFALFVSAHAEIQTVIVNHQLSADQFGQWLSEAHQTHTLQQVQFEFLPTQKSFDPFEFVKKPREQLGDVYYMVGNLGKSWAEEEYQKFYPMVYWLNNTGFRVIVNPAAYVKDVRRAVQDPETRAILWSSHGEETGAIYDRTEAILPKNIFSKDASGVFQHLVLGNCYGESTIVRYSFPDAIKPHHWVGEITTDDMFDYLKSKKWQRHFRSDLNLN